MKNRSSDFIQLLTASMNLVSQTNDHVEISKIIEKLLMDFSDSDSAILFLFDSSQQLLYSKSNTYQLSMIEPIGIIGEAFLTKEASCYNHLASEKNYVPDVDNPDSLKLRSQIILPIIENETLLGIVRTSRSLRYKNPYTQRELDLLVSLHTFLIKIIHVLFSDLDTNVDIDIAKINQNIEEVEERKTPTVDKDSMMMFLSNTVHDIRTPANSLYGFLELIEERIEDKQLKGFIENAKESAQFINTLTDTILQQTKENYKIQDSKPKTIHTINFLAQTANIFSAEMSTKEIDYLVYIDPLIPKEIQVDATKLKRVIINLIGNAYKFTPKGKRIDLHVKYSEKEKSIKISVADQGVGIHPSHQKDIFQAFEQAEEQTSIQFGGTGLGLSISAKYVQDLGGKLKLKSAPEKGSKFYFTLPIKIINQSPSYEKFKNTHKLITILTDCKKCINPHLIGTYLIKLGMPEEKIKITDTLPPETTHLFCFQHKLNSNILEVVREKNITLLIVEESLFSLNGDKSISEYPVISEKTYYGDMVHSTVFSEKKKKVLLADDNKTNLLLLQSMLETEFVEISTTADGIETLEVLKKTLEEGDPFDAIYMDKHMPLLSGSEVMQKYRDHEKEKKVSPIFAISITGDPNLSDHEKKLYDLFVTKPFNTEKVRAAIRSLG